MGTPRGNILAMLAGGLATVWALWLVLAVFLHWPFVPALLSLPLGVQPVPLVLIGLVLVTATDFRHGWSRSSSAALVLCLMPFAILIMGPPVAAALTRAA